MADLEGFVAWLELGLGNQWISEVSCFCHDQVAMSPDEERDWEDAGEVCIPVVRLWGPEGAPVEQGNITQLPTRPWGVV